MNTHFLENITKRKGLEGIISRILPGQTDPWLVSDGTDPIGYVYISEDCEDFDGITVVVDIKGGCGHKSRKIISFLEELKLEVGGTIASDK